MHFVMELDWIQVIIGFLGTALTGGALGSIISLKYIKSKEKALAQQAQEQATGMNLDNIKEAINIYKDALEDIKGLHDKTELEYERQLERYENQLKAYEIEISQLNMTISEMSKNQLKFGEELGNLKK